MTGGTGRINTNKTRDTDRKRGESENIITHRFMADNKSWGTITQPSTHAMGREEFVSPQHGIYSHIGNQALGLFYYSLGSA